MYNRKGVHTMSPYNLVHNILQMLSMDYDPSAEVLLLTEHTSTA